MGFFSDTSKFFKKAGSDAGKWVKQASKDVSRVVSKDIVPTVGKAITTVYSDAKGFIKTNQDLIKQGIGGTKDVLIGAENTIGGLGYPFMIGAGVLGAILLLKK